MKYKYNGQWKELSVKASDTIPVGAIISWNSLTPPTNWLICDGSYVSKTTYADLYAAIGDTYLDGGTAPAGTFRLPNYKGRTGVGYDADDTDFNEIGKKIGSKELQAHNHEIFGGFGTGTTNRDSISFGAQKAADGTYNYGYGGIPFISNAGTGDSGNIQPSIVEVKIIKAFQSSGVVANVAHTYTESDEDTYGCDYVNNLVKYSTNEVNTGNKWINGKPIYRKVCNGIFNNDDVLIQNVDTLIQCYGSGDNSTGLTRNLPYYELYQNKVYRLTVTKENSNIKVVSQNADIPTSTTSDTIIILEYTKTTD